MACFLVSKISRWLRAAVVDPEYKLCQFLLRFLKADRIPDRMYIKYQYHYVFGRPLDLKNPVTFNEKLNWLKLYDRNPLYTTLVDKVEVKKWVAERIGEQYIIPTLGVYDSFDEIDFDVLPDRFVLKCTHDSGSVAICRDKANFDKESARKTLTDALSHNHYLKHREWPYKNVKPRIIAEVLLDDGSRTMLCDYKYWCFKGIPRVMYITNKSQCITEDFYDMDFCYVEIDRGFPHHIPKCVKPQSFELMKNLAVTLSGGMPFVRVDFFDIKGKVYFAEMTFFDWAGLKKFSNCKTDIQFGLQIDVSGC